MLRRSRPLTEHMVEPTIALFGICLAALTPGEDYLPIFAATALPFLTASFAAIRFWPSAIATTTILAVLLLFAPSYTEVGGIALLINLYALIRLRPRYGFWCLIVWVPLVIGLVVRLARPGTLLSELLFLTGLSALTVSAALARRNKEKLVATTKELAEQRLRNYRLELSRDLHDTVAQTLAHAAMRANLLTLDPDLPEQAVAELEQIAADCHDSAQDLRTLLSTLREPEGSKKEEAPTGRDDLVKHINAESERLTRAGFLTTLDIDLTDVLSTRATVLAKLTREAVNNIIKHAPPNTPVSLMFRQEPGLLIAEFVNEDSGKKRRQGRLGLVGMRERTHQLDGTCEITQTDGQWRIIATLPQSSAHTSRKSLDARKN